jgi:hypothetical protein
MVLKYLRIIELWRPIPPSKAAGKSHSGWAREMLMENAHTDTPFLELGEA